MSTTRQKVAALLPLVERMHKGHCWLKTADGPRRIAEPFTEFMLAEHCAGRKAYGLAFVAPGASTTRAAAFDLDSHKGETPWPRMIEIAKDLVDMAMLFGLQGVAFRSSGGHGVHIWFLFDAPQDAHSVRQLLFDILAACGLKSGTGGVAQAEVECYPKQNEVAPDGFGSMLVLPLAGESLLLGAD